MPVFDARATERDSLSSFFFFPLGTQAFKRYLPNDEVVTIQLFFCSDGGKGTLFWGPRSQPDGYLPLRAITDVWLGKHGLLNTPMTADVDSACCVSLVTKRATVSDRYPCCFREQFVASSVFPTNSLYHSCVSFRTCFHARTSQCFCAIH